MSSKLHRNILALILGLLALAPASATAQARRPADEAFRLTAARGADGTLSLAWAILPGHYLYRERIALSAEDGRLLAFTAPPGETKEDPTFGATEVYHDAAWARIAAAALPETGQVRVAYQGCAEHGVCYPPMVKTVNLATLAISDGKGGGTANPHPAEQTPTPARNADDDGLAAVLAGGLPAMLAAFLGFGLLLALTPCVFPMIPILSGMLARSGEKLSVWRSLLLSGAYVLAMASAYAALGVAAAWSGQNLQVLLQTPLALGMMSLVFGALALSMFGLYDLQLPASWTSRLSSATAGAGGSVAGAAALGFASALIVGPCVTPPLAAALLYVAQTGDVARGAAALFALGLGMGLPLIAFGTFGGRLLPKSGQWLASVKQFFGFIFLGLAVWMSGRVLPQAVTTALWGALALSCGVWLWIPGLRGGLRGGGKASRVIRPAAGGALALLGLLLLAAGMGGPFAPLRGRLFLPPGNAEAQQDSGSTQTVSTAAAFDQALAVARAKGRPICVDFTADWCTTCQENDTTVQKNPQLRSRLANTSVIRVDLSAETGGNQSLMRRFHVVGPPTMLFLDARTGQEIEDTRTVGEISTDRFQRTLDRAGV